MINILFKYFIIFLGVIAKNPTPAGINAGIVIEIPERLLYDEIAASAGETQMPAFDVFRLAHTGYESLEDSEGLGRNILSIVDFSLASTEKRLWVIDMDRKKILFNELVAHGRNSGENFAAKFSNIPESNMSSIGFYVTGDTYTGKHGLSLYLDGRETEFNGRARERAIVIHGADYVSEDFVKTHGRLGRSFGCPALSMASHKSVIETISNGSCLFIYYPDDEYLKKSTYLNHSSTL